ncbi:MAG: TIGR03545 family protein [bacterium]
MRKKALITVIILIAVIVLISIVFTDQLVERGIEKTIQFVTGAKAEIDNLDLNIFSFGIAWDRLQIADPKKPFQNLIESGRTAFSMNLPALLRKKYVINEITVLNAQSGTSRETDGSLPKLSKKIEKRSPSKWDQFKGKITSNLEEAELFGLSFKDIPRSLNTDSLIAKADLQIIDNYEIVSSDIGSTTDKWEKYYSEFDVQEKLDSINFQIKSIDPDNINTIDKALKEIEKVRSIQKTMDSYRKEISKKREEAEADYQRLSGFKEQYKRWLSEDYENILEKAQLPGFSLKNASKIIFGKSVISKLDRYIEYTEIITRITGKAGGKKKKKPPRQEGQNIRFPEKQIWPTFLAKKIEVSTGEERIEEQKVPYLQGKVTGLTTQPRVYGKPTVFDLKGKYGGNREILFNAVLDHTKKNYRDNYSLGFRNISLKGIELEKNKYIPENIKNGFADIDIDIQNTEEKMKIVFFLQGRELEYDFKESSDTDQITSTIRDIFRGLDRLNLKSTVVIKDQTYDFEISSNFDKKFSQSISTASSKKLTEIKNNIKSALQKKADKRITELDENYGNVYSRYLQPILEYRKESELMREELADKLRELKDKQTEDLGKKAEDLLEDLLKKKK